MADKANLLVLCGPTATGKTTLSIELAQRLNGEIICADSMQIYRTLDIGTAKVTPAEMQGIPHHLVDFLPPNERFSVAEYVKMAAQCITDITARGKLPIVTGGTGLYIQSLVTGVRFAPQQTDTSLRDTLNARLAAEGIELLWAELQAVDPAYAKTLHPNNHGRVLRALSLYLQTGKTMSQQLADSLPAERPYNDVLIGLDYLTRETLYSQIDARVNDMMARDLLREARMVYDNRDAYYTAAQAIGYKEFAAYFAETATLETCVAALKQATRNYAKRQLTWFRHMEGMHWLTAGAPDTASKAASLFSQICTEREADGKTQAY